MKCINCKKTIPETSTICPFCKNDPNTEVITPMEFGEINENTYANDEKFDIKTYFKEPRNKKIIIFSISLIVLVISVFSFLIINLFKPKKDTSYKYFTGVVDYITEYITDNYLSNNSIKSGEYTLELDLSDYRTKFEGKYSGDLKSKRLYIDGKMRDPKEDEGGIVFENKEFTYILYADKNDIYFKSKEFYNDEYILFPLEDELGFLQAKNYNIQNVIDGLNTAVDESLKKLKYTSGNEEIDYRNDTIKSDYLELELNNSNLQIFYENFYNSLKEDSNFINEFVRIQNKKSDEIIETLENYRKTKEYEYKNGEEQNNPTKIRIYYSGKKIYRLSINYNDKKYVIDIGDTKYYFKYYESDELKANFELTIVKKQVQDVINETYEVTYKINDKTGIITLKLITKEKGSLTNIEIEQSKSVRDFTDEDIVKIKENMSYYKEDIGTIIQKLFDSYDYKCKETLECVCDDNKEKCSCMYNGEMITCKYDEVKKEY